jgi:hypothetical protein
VEDPYLWEDILALGTDIVGFVMEQANLIIILKEIPLENFNPIYAGIVNDKDGGCGEIASDLYQLYDDLPVFDCGDCVLDEYKPKPLIMKVDNRYYLALWTTSSSLSSPVEEITFKFTCSSIFRDDKEHIIVSNWRAGSHIPHDD